MGVKINMTFCLENFGNSNVVKDARTCDRFGSRGMMNVGSGGRLRVIERTSKLATTVSIKLCCLEAIFHEICDPSIPRSGTHTRAPLNASKRIGMDKYRQSVIPNSHRCPRGASRKGKMTGHRSIRSRGTVKILGDL